MFHKIQYFYLVAALTRSVNKFECTHLLSFGHQHLRMVSYNGVVFWSRVSVVESIIVDTFFGVYYVKSDHNLKCKLNHSRYIYFVLLLKGKKHFSDSGKIGKFHAMLILRHCLRGYVLSKRWFLKTNILTLFRYVEVFFSLRILYSKNCFKTLESKFVLE